MSLPIGYKHSTETKRKIGLANSIILKGRKLSDAHKIKIKENNVRYWLGKKRSKEHQEKLSLALKGKKAWNRGKSLSEDHKRKLSIAHLGKKHSEEHKRKIGLAGIGRIFSEESKRKISESNKGQIRSEETCKKIGESKKGKKLSEEHKRKIGVGEKGEKHWNWKGGINPLNDTIRKSIDYKLWRDAVFARDGYICQKTGTKGNNLEAHHILNFTTNPELRFAIDNGITLSKESHKEFHRKYGIKNNTREQLEEFLNKKL